MKYKNYKPIFLLLFLFLGFFNLKTLATDYIFFTSNFGGYSNNNTKLFELQKPSKETIFSENSNLALLETKGKKTIIFYCQKYYMSKKDKPNIQGNEMINTAYVDAQRKMQTTDVNVVVILNVWVDNPSKLNKKGYEPRRKTSIKFFPSSELDKKCIETLQKTIAEKTKVDFVPLYADKSLVSIVNLLKLELPKCAELPNKDLEIATWVDDKRIYKGEHTEISAEPDPKMPKIKVILTSKIPQEYNVRLKIQFEHSTYYDKTPDYFPSNGFFVVNSNGRIEAHINFDNKIRGGLATVEVFSKTDIKTPIKIFEFGMRGKNPSTDAVIAYIDEKGYSNEFWFFKAMFRHESGTMYKTIARQFKEDGTPTWGTPHGWGLMQLDNKVAKVATKKELWNWKSNLDKAFDIVKEKSNNSISGFKETIKDIKSKKILSENILPATEQLEGQYSYSHIKTNVSGYNIINDYFDDYVGNDKKSFLEADIIKRYNGGRYYKNEIKKEKDVYYSNWYIDRFESWFEKKKVNGEESTIEYQNYYVNDISNINQ